MAVRNLEPVLNLPAVLRLNNIRNYQHIPDSYVKKNFPLNEYRNKRVTYDREAYPLLATLMGHLLDAPIRVMRNEDEYDEDDNDESYAWGVKVDIKKIKQALEDMIKSPVLDLFDVADLYCDSGDVIGLGHIKQNEIFLRKKTVTFESDEVVIVKIKKKIYAEIQRYRRAKERY